MGKLPSEIRLTDHAKQRLLERKAPENYYNTKNLMKSSCKWYTKDDLMPNSALYKHCCYVCRKSNQMAYLTDGNIEVIYNKETKIAITVLEVKEKFLPITQYIKPSILKKIKIKKENKKMKKNETKIGVCPDCELETEINMSGIYSGLCHTCETRKQNAKHRGKEYIPYKDLPKEKQAQIMRMRKAQEEKKKEKENIIPEVSKTIPVIVENYYQVKAENNPAITPMVEKVIEKPVVKKLDPLSDLNSFITILKECGCEIPETDLKETLDVLMATDKLKDIFTTITKSSNQTAMLNLEQALNVVERKLQHDWEYNGFQEADDIKFKGFLTWRRVLKSAIFFWKKLYQTNTLIELQRAWNSYIQDPNEKVLLAGDRIDSTMKRFQITTESISTIFNTRRPFTRVFYATDKEHAYEMFIKWMADRQLHEDKSKTVITELNAEGEDGRKNV